MTNPQVRVTGVSELRRALRDAGDVENLRRFRDGLKAAANVVAQDAKARVPTRTGRARESIRATAGGNKAYVQAGKATVRYYGWLDFGSRVPKKGNPRRLGPWKGSGKGPAKGRYIYPAIAAKQEEIKDAIEAAVDDVIRSAGLT